MVRKHKKKPHTVRIGETPTPERRKQNGGVITEVIDRDSTGNVLMVRYKANVESVLGVYLAQGHVTSLEYQAGMRFCHAYARAVLKIHVEDTGAGAHGDIEMAFLTPIYSECLLREAYENLSRVQKDVVIAVCGHDEYAGTASRVLTLHRGLERLVEVWKIK